MASNRISQSKDCFLASCLLCVQKMFPFIHHALIHYCLLLLEYRNGMYCRRRRLVDPTITLMKYEFPPLLLLPNETLNITAEVEGKQMDNLEKHLILHIWPRLFWRKKIQLYPRENFLSYETCGYLCIDWNIILSGCKMKRVDFS